MYACLFTTFIPMCFVYSVAHLICPLIPTVEREKSVHLLGKLIFSLLLFTVGIIVLFVIVMAKETKYQHDNEVVYVFMIPFYLSFGWCTVCILSSFFVLPHKMNKYNSFRFFSVPIKEPYVKSTINTIRTSHQSKVRTQYFVCGITHVASSRI